MGAYENQTAITIVCPSSLTDHEGNTYTVTSLAGLCWTSNMKNTTYSDDTEIPFAKPYTCPRCATPTADFGLLYDWYSAVRGDYATPPLSFIQGICPPDWHIPTPEELNLLVAFATEELKSTGHWLITGTDDFDFTALPAGIFNSITGAFTEMYGTTGYWSCGPHTVETAYGFIIKYYCEYIQKTSFSKTDGMSVRCVMD
jgi:uncharacterized protein (TIGR02145 family)